jgi:hypothetical protein
LKHHTITLTRGQLAAIGAGRLVRLSTDVGLLTIGNAPTPGVARLWQVEQHQLRTGHTVETREPALNARLTFLPVTEPVAEPVAEPVTGQS